MIKGNGIILRPLKLSDWEKTIKWRNDFTIKYLTMMHPYPVTENMEKDWYEELLTKKNNREVYFAITNSNDIPIGFIFLKNINQIHRNCNLGIVIGEEVQRGKGNGEQAIRLLLAYAFDNLNLNKVLVEVLEENFNAIKLYKKLGFIEEGVLQQHYFSKGSYHNVIIMSLFKPF